MVDYFVFLFEMEYVIVFNLLETFRINENILIIIKISIIICFAKFLKTKIIILIFGAILILK